MEFISMGENKAMGNIPIGFLPSQVPNQKLWTRFNHGIIETGSGISQWTDVSGNGNHLKQTTDADRPSKESDGSILFGSSHFLKSDAFTFVQPELVYMLVKMVSWADLDIIFDGNTGDSGTVYQTGTTPNIQMYAGSAVNPTTELSVGVYGIIAAVINGANSYLKINNNTAKGPANAGAANMGGIHIASRGDGLTQQSNIQVKEIIAYDTSVHDDETTAQIINYLARVGGLSI